MAIRTSSIGFHQTTAGSSVQIAYPGKINYEALMYLKLRTSMRQEVLFYALVLEHRWIPRVPILAIE